MSDEPNRYLTIKEKAQEIMRWDSLRAQYRGSPPPRGGMGEPDPEIYALTDALIQLEGVCTVQSCAGHNVEAADGSGPYRYPGHLWLRLSRPVWVAVEENVPELLRCQWIEAASFLYYRGSVPVVGITFEGQERGYLAESSVAILDFMRRCAQGAGVGR